MRGIFAAGPLRGLIPLALLTLIVGGCSRARHEHRQDADSEAYCVISERNGDARWTADDVRIDMDPRSRYFDRYDPDCAPMPQDDPTAHQYMRCVDGMKGWKHWYDNGTRHELENPSWRNELPLYSQTSDDGAVKLDVDSGLKLAYVHSPNHQRQLEELYLSALDVTRERFLLDTQFFGGYDAFYNHAGRLTANGESNGLTLGRGTAANPLLQARRSTATAGTLVAGFANSFVFDFTSGDTNFASSLANFSIMQPLLRGAGRDIALEGLTDAERRLLANLRAYAQFRQGFYTQVAIGELGVTGPQRGGPTTRLTSFSGSGGVGGYVGLLQQLQQVRNNRDNLNLQLRTLARLEAFYAKGLITLVQVDQFRQSIESQRATLLASVTGLELAMDRYKTGTLGLPPDLEIELDDTLIRQFQLVAPEATDVLDAIVTLQRRTSLLFVEGEAQRIPELDEVRHVIEDAAPLIEPMQRQFETLPKELARMDEAQTARQADLTEVEKERLETDRDFMDKTLKELRKRFDVASVRLAELQEGLSGDTRDATARGMVNWLTEVLTIVDKLTLIQARARVEAVSVESIQLDPQVAFDIAKANRLDFMNGRTALVDTWRQIAVRADALQSNLTVVATGDVGTARDNAVSFRPETSNLRLGMQFDAPFTRLEERNNYREALVTYQRDRRAFIQSHDGLQLGLRALLRQIDQFRENLEIQRRAVTIAIRRVDQTQGDLTAPGRIPAPGQRPFINPTTAINLLSAQSAFLSSQNSFLGAWLNYYAARMRLYRELGTMVLDPEGRWVEYPIEVNLMDAEVEGSVLDPQLLDFDPQGGEPPAEDGAANQDEASIPALPPAIPAEWKQFAEFADELDGDSKSLIDRVSYSPDGDALAPMRDRSGIRQNSRYHRVAREVLATSTTEGLIFDGNWPKWLNPHELQP